MRRLPARPLFKRLIEEENAGPVNHRRGRGPVFLHAVELVRDHRFRPVRELHEFQQSSLRCFVVFCPARTFCRQRQILRPGETSNKPIPSGTTPIWRLISTGCREKSIRAIAFVRRRRQQSVSILIVVDFPAPFARESRKTVQRPRANHVFYSGEFAEFSSELSVRIAASDMRAPAGVV